MADDPNIHLAGIAINDPIIGDGTVQQQIILADYVEYWNNLLFLNDSFLEDFRAVHDKCGYTEYQDKYLQFPPPNESFPILSGPTRRNNYSCDQFDNAYAAILEVNPCFNIYHISETW